MDKKIFQKKATSVYIIYILTFFVWYTHYKYFDIMQAKRAAFLLGTGIYDLVMVLTTLLDRKKSSSEHFGNSLTWNKLLPMMMILVWLVGLIGAVDIQESFWGYGGKCTGFLLYALGTLSLVFICEHLEWSTCLTWVLLFSAMVVCVLQVLNRWGYDPFAMYDGMVDEERRLFISTVGQINYNASLNCMIMAVIMNWFLLCKERLSRYVYGTAIVVVFAGSICCCSDSVYLGVVAILAIQLIYVGWHPEKWWRFAQELLLLEITIIVLWFTWSFVNRIFVWDTTLLLFDFRILSRVSMLLLMFIVLGTGLYFLTRNKRKGLWPAFCIGIIVYVPVQIFLIIRYVMTDPAYWSAITSWGGYRTEIWNRCWELFREASVWHKLFGYGFNNVSQALELCNLSEFEGTVIADAHNIVINTLITSGLSGILIWAAFLGKLCYQAIRLLKNHEEVLLILTGVIVYLLQGMVNGPQIFTTPLFLVETGVFLSMIKRG